MEKRVTDVDYIPNEVRQIYNAICEVVLVVHTEKMQEKKFKV
jgi:hypothetical protein